MSHQTVATGPHGHNRGESKWVDAIILYGLEEK